MKQRLIINRLLLSLFLIQATFSLSAQVIKIIEPALMECEYLERAVRDTLKRESDYDSEYVCLRIGKTTSVFFTPREVKRDSLSFYNPRAAFTMFKEDTNNGISHINGMLTERTIKNYPVGKVTVDNRFSLMRWIYEEDWEKPHWEILDSAKVILDYPCQLAVTSYRGRTWFAWFTQDIPIEEGPWKLCGLPGLILEAYDAKQDYHFTATSLRNSNLQDVGIYDYKARDYAKTDRIKFLREKFKAIHTDQGAIVSQVFDLNNGAPVKAKKDLPHRNYEFEETDYH